MPEILRNGSTGPQNRDSAICVSLACAMRKQEKRKLTRFIQRNFLNFESLTDPKEAGL